MFIRNGWKQSVVGTAHLIERLLHTTTRMAAVTPTPPSTSAPTRSATSAPAEVRPMKHPAQLRKEKQRVALATKKKPTGQFIPGTVNLQVLGAGANGAPAAVYLFTDQSRYLFNCGEGTQRLAHEHKTKLSRLEHIFVTRNTWTMMGGLPGLALTVQDAGVRELALHGPPHLDSILQSMKRFVVLKNLQINTEDCTHSHFVEDAVMKVRCVPLHSDRSSEKMVVAYICTLKPRFGTLNLEKCVDHGITPGPQLGLLKSGIDVTLADGTIVRSKDVSEPDEPVNAFIFLDIPAEEYLPALQAHAQLFHSLQAGEDQRLPLVVHFTPAHMLANTCYQSFVEKFPETTEHLYLQSPRNTFSGYVAAHRIQYQLNQLHPGVFPLLGECAGVCATKGISNTLKKTKLIEEEAQAKPVEEKEPQGLNSLTSFHLRPPKKLDHSCEAKLTPEEYIAETQALPEFPALLEQLKEQLLAVQPPSSSSAEQYPKITFLGTGSCIPNKTRNVSSILLQPHAASSIVLDCGEGTLGQIVRFFGSQRAEQVVRDLQAIYISHLHADHHIGLIGLLKERRRLLGAQAPRLLLLAPRQISPWLDFYNERIENLSDTYELKGNAELLQHPLELADGGGERSGMGVHSIATCLVRHCPHSFGVALELTAAAEADSAAAASRRVKITYSGDSMPCQDLVDLGRNSTVLIHEATMEDDLVDEARVKMHSTISQAIEQGRQMEAQHIILTHFSQRYAKMPRLPNASAMSESDGDRPTVLLRPAPEMRNVAIAFDNMQVTLEDLPHFHLLYPALHALFAEHTEELEQKALRREIKQQRKRKLLAAD